jgi:hypothetical protein
MTSFQASLKYQSNSLPFYIPICFTSASNSLIKTSSGGSLTLSANYTATSEVHSAWYNSLEVS